jgi:DNA-binding NarL/FixJ family response regulator
MMENKGKRVIVADDHSLFRDGIISLLEAADFNVVAQVGDGEAAVDAVRRLQPDLVLLDITMPKRNGLEALRTIKSEFPKVQVVILTVSDEDEDLFAAIKSGADGYLLKDLNASEFLEILNGLERGEAAITRKTAARLMAGFKSLTRRESEPTNELTERELEVLKLVGKGLSNRNIAEQLFISENTVKYHLRNILQKTGAQNRTEAVTHALQVGLFEPDQGRV